MAAAQSQSLRLDEQAIVSGGGAADVMRAVVVVVAAAAAVVVGGGRKGPSLTVACTGLPLGEEGGERMVAVWWRSEEETELKNGHVLSLRRSNAHSLPS